MRKILIALFILAFVSTAPSIGNGEQRGAFTDLTTNMEFVFVKGGYVTVVGMYDGCDYRCFVRGNGLSPENLNKELSGYKYLITFYGAAFDIPFLFRSMPGLRFDIPHFDICFGSRKLGFQGGLKKLESSMGVERDEAVKGMDGYDAVKLWGYAQNGSAEALDLLKLYNREDTVNLFGIAEVIYQRLRAQTGIEEYLR